MAIIPVIAEALDIMPSWSKYILFLAILLGATQGLVWLFDIRTPIDQMLMFVGSVFGIGYLSLAVLVIISFLTVPLIVMIKLGRSDN